MKRASDPHVDCALRYGRKSCRPSVGAVRQDARSAVWHLPRTDRQRPASGLPDRSRHARRWLARSCESPERRIVNRPCMSISHSGAVVRGSPEVSASFLRSSGAVNADDPASRKSRFRRVRRRHRPGSGGRGRPPPRAMASLGSSDRRFNDASWVRRPDASEGVPKAARHRGVHRAVAGKPLGLVVFNLTVGTCDLRPSLLWPQRIESRNAVAETPSRPYCSSSLIGSLNP